VWEQVQDYVSQPLDTPTALTVEDTDCIINGHEVCPCHVSKSLLIFCATLFGQYPAQMTTVKDPVDPADTAVRAGTQVRPASN
jgi:hypothetical protein